MFTLFLSIQVMGLKTSVAELSSSRAAVEASLAGTKHELEAARWDDGDNLMTSCLNFHLNGAFEAIVMACFRAQVAALHTDCSKKQKLIEEGE